MNRNNVFLRLMKSYLLLFLLLVFGFSHLFAQVSREGLMKHRDFPKDTIWPKKSTPYYDDYSNQLGLFLQMKYKTTRILIKDVESGKELDYSPKNQVYLGPGFTYKVIGNGLSFSFGFLNDNDSKEPTTRLDLYVNFMMKRLVFDFGLRYYKNFTLKNPSDFLLDPGSDYYTRPDIATLFFGIGGMYVFNYKKFSYRAAFTPTAIQKKSAGSFMLGNQIFIQGLVGDSSIFPAVTNLPAVTSHSTLYVGLTTAYAYNFIIKKDYYIAMSLSSAIEFGKAVTIINHDEFYDNRYPTMHIRPRIATGINKTHWFLGVSMNKNYFVQLVQNGKYPIDFSFRSSSFKVFFGYRFNWFSRGQLDD